MRLLSSTKAAGTTRVDFLTWAKTSRYVGVDNDTCRRVISRSNVAPRSRLRALTNCQSPSKHWTPGGQLTLLPQWQSPAQPLCLANGRLRSLRYRVMSVRNIRLSRNTEERKPLGINQAYTYRSYFWVVCSYFFTFMLYVLCLFIYNLH